MSAFDKENQHKFIRIAKQLKNGIPPGEGEEGMIADILSQHPEFEQVWELGEMSATPQEINGQIVNPFVHTALHLAMEKQIEKNDPMEVVEAINNLLKGGKERHEIIHQIGEVYANIYFANFRRGQMFEEVSYIEIVREMTRDES